MKKLLVIVLLLMGCEGRKIAHRPLPQEEVLGDIDRCTTVRSFIDGKNKCYIVDYCGSSNATISCVKNEEMAPNK